MFDLQAKVRRSTRLVAVGYAANAVGTINDVAEVVRLAHGVGAMRSSMPCISLRTDSLMCVRWIATSWPIAALRGHEKRASLMLRFNQRVERLTMHGGKVDGAAGVDEQTGTPFEVKAEQVVVAAGGINGGDLTRVRQNWHRDWGKPPETLLSGSHRFADGKLHDATVAAGGVLTHLDNMWNYAAGVHHPKPRKPMHGLSLVPPRSALWLNWRGMRIGPQPLVSGFDTRRLVTDICAQEKQYSWQLMNMKIALKELAISGAEHNPSIRDRRKLGFLRDILFGNRWLVNEMISNCRDFVSAGSLPELVEKMNALQGDNAVELTPVQEAVDAL